MGDEDRSTEERLLAREGEEGIQSGAALTKWAPIFQEAKNLTYVAAPMVAVILSQNLLQVVASMVVGHVSELALSSTAIAISISNVTGFSFLLGMASALETLCGQAYGAEQYQKVGNQTYTAIFSLFLVCIPLSIVWIYMGKILVILGQDPVIAAEAGKFIICLIPALFAYAILQPIVRYYQIQSLTIPMLISSCAALALHVPLCWALVFKTGLSNLGAAISLCVANWLNVVFLVLYMNWSSSCAKTRVSFSMEIFRGFGGFFRLAIPSALMICLEWWSFELLILLSGLLPNPELETSVLSVCLTTTSTLYAIPYGLSLAVSTRVSNELGAGNPQAARLSAYTVVILTITEATVVSAVLFASRHVFGYTFSNVKAVVDYFTNIAPLICLSVIMDSFQGTLSGISRGCGWQHIGAYINLAAFYIFGIPSAAILAFLVHLRGIGLWTGIQIGQFTQIVMLAVVTKLTNWEKQADKARERIFDGMSPADNG
uniref:Protein DETOXIFICATION n=2 Tax=Rhizophora mucronata TaxID=61149 RepID=A0A2P2IN61_RHIMU